MPLEEKRTEIDAIDSDIVSLLGRRAAVAREIAALKRRTGLPIVDEDRERAIIRRLTMRSSSDISDEGLSQIYRAVLDESRRIQASVAAEGRPGRVAVQGIAGSYSEEAAIKLAGPDTVILECRDFSEVFDAVASEKAGYAVVPLCNSIIGPIQAVTELVERHKSRILDQFELEIHHVLAGTDDSTITGITSVRSHPAALRQCSYFLDANHSIERIADRDTASSIQAVARQNDPAIGAIGSERAARLYGAKILCEGIANRADNRTTFGLIEAGS